MPGVLTFGMESPLTPERIPFVLAATDYGPMILSRLDQTVAKEVLQNGEHSRDDVMELLGMLTLRREFYGDGVTVIDGGANIGMHTVAWAKAMLGWGSVMSFEPQERIFFALCGNIALNNLFNARAFRSALSKELGAIMVPEFDFQKPGNYGGLSCAGHIDRLSAEMQFYNPERMGQVLKLQRPVNTVTIDSLGLARVDLIKLDIEGMEPMALEGAQKTIERCKPLIFAECWACGIEEVRSRVSPGYRLIPTGMNVICIHEDDRINSKVQFVEGPTEPRPEIYVVDGPGKPNQ